ncbi:MAG: hypothetical protein CM15mP47_3420 [Methanobacteriota archaeon]|nr:MAG: hypothetical protein CM15mP47_3420 [Euryarchaeota archaeon]
MSLPDRPGYRAVVIAVAAMPFEIQSTRLG